ncbi:MAG: xylR [Phycisphaerales bacterium]|nr:xylR [Phycisphaerales bacterium]
MMDIAVVRRPVPRASAVRQIAFYGSERSEYATRVLEGVLRYVEDRVGFMLRDFWDDLTAVGRREALLGAPPPWAAGGADGVVAILPHGRAVVPWASDAGVPIVSIGSDFRDALPTVHVSADSVAELAIRHFLGTGYPNVAFVGVRGFVAVDHRRSALERQLAEIGRPLWSYGLETNPWPGNYDLEERAAAEEGLERFLLDAPTPLGVLATTDHAGRVVCAACRRLGLIVPQEVGVLGIDNYTAARTCVPPLSSIQSPGEEVGYQAMALLDRLTRGKPGDRAAAAVEKLVAVPATQVVARQSTGAAPGGTHAHVIRALALIRERACDGIAVEAILDDLTISRSTLERQFAAMIGRTPGQELLRVRLARAKELLRHSDLPISKIAAMTGYERSSSFSDFFSRHAGLSPRAYRKGGIARPPEKAE